MSLDLEWTLDDSQPDGTLHLSASLPFAVAYEAPDVDGQAILHAEEQGDGSWLAVVPAGSTWHYRITKPVQE